MRLRNACLECSIRAPPLTSSSVAAEQHTELKEEIMRLREKVKDAWRREEHEETSRREEVAAAKQKKTGDVGAGVQ